MMQSQLKHHVRKKERSVPPSFALFHTVKKKNVWILSVRFSHFSHEKHIQLRVFALFSAAEVNKAWHSIPQGVLFALFKRGNVISPKYFKLYSKMWGFLLLLQATVCAHVLVRQQCTPSPPPSLHPPSTQHSLRYLLEGSPCTPLPADN